MTLTLYTIGHGNRKIGELIALLKEAGVDTLVDVRAQPRSRHNPQFNDDALRLACENAGIVYHWAGKQLGGMRTPRPDSPHLALDEGLRGFADHMDTDAFRQGAVQLQNLAAGSRGDSSFGDGGSSAHENIVYKSRRAKQGYIFCGYRRPLPNEQLPRALGASRAPGAKVCMLCAERNPAHCHRSLIADYLVLQGMRVVHLVDPGETREHVFSSEARRESAALVYDRQATRPLGLDR